MCEKPMGVFGGLALGSLFGLVTGRKKTMTTRKTETEAREHRPWRHPAFVFLAVPKFAGIVLTAAASAPWPLLFAFAAAAVALAAGGLLLMRALHGAVASPALTARLTARPALPRAWARQPVPRWNVVSVEKVPASQPAITGRVMAPGEKIGS